MVLKRYPRTALVGRYVTLLGEPRKEAVRLAWTVTEGRCWPNPTSITRRKHRPRPGLAAKSQPCDCRRADLHLEVNAGADVIFPVSLSGTLGIALGFGAMSGGWDLTPSPPLGVLGRPLLQAGRDGPEEETWGQLVPPRDFSPPSDQEGQLLADRQWQLCEGASHMAWEGSEGPQSSSAWATGTGEQVGPLQAGSQPEGTAAGADAGMRVGQGEAGQSECSQPQSQHWALPWRWEH